MTMTTDPGAHLPALGAHEREEVGTHLQSMLVELVDLALLGKQLHWSWSERISARFISRWTS
jgi:hypothetical protein